MFTKHPIKKDVSLVYNENAIKESIKNLVMTKNYERPFHPEIGSPVSGMLFENMTPVTANILKKSIEDVINNYEPRAKVIDVMVSAYPSKNAIQLVIVFKCVNKPQPISLKLILEHLR